MKRMIFAAVMAIVVACGVGSMSRSIVHAQDNQCPGGCDNGGGGSYDDYGGHAGCMTNGNICGYGWNNPYQGQIPTDPYSFNPSTGPSCTADQDCYRYCNAIQQATNELGGDMYFWFTGSYTWDGEPLYTFQNYYGWWGGWAYINGAGNCVGTPTYPSGS